MERLVARDDDAGMLAAELHGPANPCRALADDPARRRDLGFRARAIAEIRFERDTTLRRVFGPLYLPTDAAEDVVVN